MPNLHQVEAELVSPAAVPAQSKKKQQSRQEPYSAFNGSTKTGSGVPAQTKHNGSARNQAPAAAGPMHSGYVQRTPRFTTYQAGVMDFSGFSAGRKKIPVSSPVSIFPAAPMDLCPSARIFRARTLYAYYVSR